MQILECGCDLGEIPMSGMVEDDGECCATALGLLVDPNPFDMNSAGRVVSRDEESDAKEVLEWISTAAVDSEVCEVAPALLR